jgi:hypothetical protein
MGKPMLTWHVYWIAGVVTPGDTRRGERIATVDAGDARGAMRQMDAKYAGYQGVMYANQA